mmetsp:Transcript_34159/g.96231  ORF Transcript_34159/g.96231 Transcript_34159/m.96231 type:complete len:202 (+) Transcript_34159:564-1169(+)
MGPGPAIRGPRRGGCLSATSTFATGRTRTSFCGTSRSRCCPDSRWALLGAAALGSPPSSTRSCVCTPSTGARSSWTAGALRTWACTTSAAAWPSCRRTASFSPAPSGRPSIRTVSLRMRRSGTPWGRSACGRASRKRAGWTGPFRRAGPTSALGSASYSASSAPSSSGRASSSSTRPRVLSTTTQTPKFRTLCAARPVPRA